MIENEDEACDPKFKALFEQIQHGKKFNIHKLGGFLAMLLKIYLADCHRSSALCKTKNNVTNFKYDFI